MANNEALDIQEPVFQDDEQTISSVERGQRRKASVTKIARGIGTGARGVGKGVGFLVRGIRTVASSRRENVGGKGYYDLLPEERDTWKIQHQIDSIRKKEELKSLKQEQRQMRIADKNSKINFMDIVVGGNPNKKGLDLNIFGMKSKPDTSKEKKTFNAIFGDLRKDRPKKTIAPKQSGQNNNKKKGQSPLEYALFGKPRKKK